MTTTDRESLQARVLAHASRAIGEGDAPLQADSFQVTLAWLVNEPLLPGRRYELHLDHQRAEAILQRPKHALADNSQPVAARTLQAGQVGVLSLTTDRPIGFRPASDDPHQALFTLRDPVTHDVVAVGAISFALRRSQNVQWQALDIDRDARAELLGQRPACVWFTGLSGSGKSTIANLVERRLHSLGHHTFLLDGDNVRHGLNRDLGFTDADRVENIRRVGEVARLMTDAGIIVLAAFISPFRAERRMVRDLMAPGEFIEVYVDTPLAVAEERDVKGLYAKARSGQLRNFTGIDSPYEPPEHPEVRVDTTATTAEAAADMIVARLAGQPAAR